MFDPMVLAALLLTSPPADTPQELAREGAWEINYDEEACHLIARFGTGDDQVFARFTWYQPGDTFDLALIGNRFKTSAASPTVSIKFGTAKKFEKRSAMAGSLGNFPLVMVPGFSLDYAAPPGKHVGIIAMTPVAREAAVSSLTVAGPGGSRVRLVFGSLEQPMQAARTCTADLVRHWGYDPQVQASLSEPVKPAASPLTWIRGDDYPRGAVSGGQNGIVAFRLDVDEKGAITACHVLARSKPDVFGDLTCRLLLERARFHPARDAAGAPVRSFYVSKIRWQMPG